MKFYSTGVIALLLLLFSTHVNGQETRDGFIIRPSGDYQYGTILLDPKLNSYETCSFKADGKDEFRLFTADNIQGYGVINGIRFITKEITVGQDKRNFFLKNDIEGIVKIYTFNDRFFVERDTFMEVKAAKGSENYKQVLAEILKDCKNILPVIKKTKLELTSLRTLFFKYQRCTTDESSLEPSFQIKADLLAGMEISTPTLDFNHPSRINNVLHLKDKTLFGAGVNVNFSFKNSRHVSWVTGAYFYDQSFYVIQRGTSNGYASTDKINFDYREVSIPIGIQYSFMKREKKIMPYLKAGVSIPITLKSSLAWENQTENSTSVYFNTYEMPQEFKQSLQLSISAGTTFSVISSIRNVFEVSYQTTGGKLLDNHEWVTVSGNRITVFLGIRF